MRHVFSANWMVADLWAKQTQADGRTSYYRISFKGDTIYSYSHYAIGKLYPRLKVCLLQSDGYSVSTGKHISLARWAASKEGYKCFHVPKLDAGHDVNIAYYLDQLKQTVIQWSNATVAGRWILDRNNGIHGDLVEYCKAFDIKMPITLGLYLNREYPFIKRRFYQLPERDSQSWRSELFLPRWLADKGMENVEPKDLLKTKNAEIRREIIRLLGIERICYALNARVIDKRGNYELITLDLKDGRTRPFLKMLNPSVPDIWHVEGVHPCIKTVQDALNYRRYGDEMLEPGKMPPEIEQLLRWNIERRRWENDPVNMVIRPEYQTSELFKNPKNWQPEQLT